MEELGRINLVKIKHQFTYLCCFNSNIQSLRDEAQNLEAARAGLQMQVEAAENNAEVILPEVKTWLANASNKIQVDKSGIDDEIPTVKNGCWGVKSRYRLSREAVKITGEMKQLVEDHNQLNHISTPPLPAAPVAIPLGTTYEFQSKKQIEEEILEALRGKEVTTIGICGMGGVGKTIMAKRIMNKVKEENTFEEIFMVIVSPQVEMLKIQDEFAESLDLRLGEETLLARANKLRARLMGTKRILIILDDVWEKLKLEDLGIPRGNELHEGCKILLTSRNRDVLNKMNVQKAFVMETLTETEAWFLFREKAGTCVDDPNLLSTAEKVARECKGLPIALITVGRALKDQTSITFWEDALQQLKNSNLQDMTGVIRNVYLPLKLSYIYLESRHAKSFFLLCGIFPEDTNISLEELTWYCMGLRMFGGITNLEQVRNRLFKIVDMLKNRFLLLEGDDEHHVRMHDVVRDVAICIASEEEREGLLDVKFNSRRSLSEYTFEWVSVFSEKISSLLRMHGLNREKRFEIKGFSLFEGMKELNVLSFECISLKSLPLQLLKNLRTLHLQYCTLEFDLSVVGELLSLEILCCRYCDGIEELPVDIGKLNQLKLLDFTYCDNLKRIPPGVISNLVQLEEFKMLDSFGGWELAAAEVQGQERRNACLNEFENLSKLTCLEIQIDDFDLAAEEIFFSPNISKYKIRIGNFGYHTIRSYGKSMSMNFPRDINLGSWVLRFLKSANELYLKGDGSNSLGDDLLCTQKDLFRSLKKIVIRDCNNIGSVIFDGFSQLEVFEIYNSSSTRTLFSSSIVINLANLKELRISKCKEMVKVIEDDEEMLCEKPDQLFPSLRCLYLEDLPKLESFCSWRHDFQLPSLEKVWIIGCHFLGFFTMKNVLFRSLKKIVIRDYNNIERVIFDRLKGILIAYDNISNIWCHQTPPALFSELEVFEIYNSSSTRTLFSPSIVIDLVNLKELRISKCKEMVKVIEDDEEMLREKPDQLFPSLRCLYLEDLPKLESFCNWRHDFQLTSLEKVWIKGCTFLGFFTMKNVLFLSSKKIVIHDCNNIGSVTFDGLNPPVFLSQLEVFEIYNSSSTRTLFSSSIVISLVNLKELRISKCKDMLKVIEDDEEMLREKPDQLFPSLRCLYLEDLPKLESFCSWRHDFQLPSLEKVWIKWCPFLGFFTMKNVLFRSLKKIVIRDCNNIGSLFSSPVAENLDNLKILSIFRCKEMTKVIENDAEGCIRFPNLKVLDFGDLPKLQRVCNWRCELQLPSLENVDIYSCPLLEKISMGSISTPNLKRLQINSKLKVVGDLNDAIQLHFKANQVHQLNSTTQGQESISAQPTEEDQNKGETEEEEINEKSWICKELSLKLCF